MTITIAKPAPSNIIFKLIVKYFYSQSSIKLLPLNKGAKRNTPIHPKLENCPIIISIKNNGMPQKNNIKRYGIKNAPENENLN